MLPNIECFVNTEAITNEEVAKNFTAEDCCSPMNADEFLDSRCTDVQTNEILPAQHDFLSGQIPGLNFQPFSTDGSTVEGNFGASHFSAMEITDAVSMEESNFLSKSLPGSSQQNWPEAANGTHFQINSPSNVYLYEVTFSPDGQIGLLEPFVMEDSNFTVYFENPVLNPDLSNAQICEYLNISNPPTINATPPNNSNFLKDQNMLIKSNHFVNSAVSETQTSEKLERNKTSEKLASSNKILHNTEESLSSFKTPTDKSPNQVQEKCLIEKKQFKCAYEDCDAVLSSEFNKRRHEASVHASPVKCPQCDKFFKKESLRTHARRVHDKLITLNYCKEKNSDRVDQEKNKKFRCSYEDCKVVLSTRASKWQHEQLVHKSSVKCAYENCGKFLKPSWMARHVKKFHNKSEAPCKIKTKVETFSCSYEKCKKTFKNRISRNNHVLRVHCPPVKCPYENCKSFVKPWSLKLHIQGSHLKLQKQCKVCEKAIPIYQVYSHQRNCGKVGEGTKDMKSLKSKENQSDNCKNFYESAILRLDIEETQKKIEKRPCRICKKLVSLFLLKDHFKMCAKSEGKKFVCPYKQCFSSFTVRANRLKHLNDVHQSRVKCTYENCNAFLKPKCLAGHIKAVHKKLKKRCDNCGKLVNSVSFRAHFSRCTSNGEKKLCCVYEGCDATFTTAGNRYSHINYFHLNKKQRV